jgi:predicted RNA-binding Zn-ribbon protein involved in translation (DUF1610 family)
MPKEKKIKLSDLKSNEKNPRVLRGARLDVLKKSIKDFAKMMSIRPIIIDENNVVLGGNMRLVALKELKYKSVPESWVKKVEGLTDKEKDQFIIKDNVSAGEWDYDLLANSFDYDEIKDWGFDGFMITEEDNFEPTLDPEIDTSDVDDEKIQKAAKVLAAKMLKDLKKTIDVTCPECGMNLVWRHKWIRSKN